VVLFLHISPLYAKVAWYIGMSFFFVFFAYRYNVSKKLYRAVMERELIKKIREKESLNDDDRAALEGILCGLTSNKERINFIVIFVLSGIALVIALVMDIISILQ